MANSGEDLLNSPALRARVDPREAFARSVIGLYCIRKDDWLYV